MKRRVSPAPGRTRPVSSATVSSVRTTVVPTDHTAPPATRRALIVVAALVGGVYGLVAVAIGGGRRAPDVRRQRHRTVTGDGVLRAEGADEPDAPQAAAQDFENLHGAVVPKHDAPARLQLAT